MVELGSRRTNRKGAGRKLSAYRLRASHFYPKCWIETEFNNQNAPSTFYSFSSELGAAAAINVAWETAVETDNKGFHLYRSPRYDGPFEPLTDKLIPGPAL